MWYNGIIGGNEMAARGEYRDQQRNAVYRGEAAARKIAEDLDLVIIPKYLALEEMRAIVRQIMGDGVRVTFKGKNTSYYFPRENKIEFSVSQLNLWTALHETAHAIDEKKYKRNDGTAGHGPEYAGIHLALIQIFLGEKVKNILYYCYKAANVLIENSAWKETMEQYGGILSERKIASGK
jgi:hypothetical protein